ncbi:MAG: ATP-binding protein [Nitrospirae bacterium]|nr:ATP-binding protein [Nitrospirota bacterium]
MIKRIIQEKIEMSLTKYPVVGILGPRQVGKTTLAKMIMGRVKKKVIYLDLELPSDLNKLRDPELYLSPLAETLVIIDEIQRMPSLFPLLRALADRKKTAGRFLILGSASPELIRHSSESLAGRIIYHELSPFIFKEIDDDKIQKLWLRGGYPQSFLSKNNDDSVTWRETFIKTYLEMDIPQLGIRIPAQQLRRFWTMIAHSHGQLWNASKIAGSLGISAPTVKHYLDILEETFIVRQIQPYHSNLKKRLIKSPRVYIRDSGMLHALLNIRTLEELYGHPSLGSSWEGFIAEQIIRLLPDRRQVFFYRTGAGAEIDLVLFDGRHKHAAVEIKYSMSPKVERGFWNAYEDLSCQKGYVIYPGTESYPVGKNIFTLPVKDLEKVFD